MTASLTRQLYTILERPVSDEDRRRAALHVLDWTGCAIIGARSAAGQLLARESGIFGDGPCRAIGVTGGVSAARAAFVNGGLGNVLEMDDIHRTSILHPGPVVIPAVLAAAQAFHLSSRQFLDGIVRGYEALIRIGRSVGPEHYAKWHNTGSCGPFGAAAGVAFALDLNEEQFVSALGNAGSTASSLWRCRHEPVMTKQWHTARAAEDGLAAAALAREGFTGPEYILEGEQGFYQATAPGADPDAVIRDPRSAWLIHDTSFKPWPACRHAHAAIDAALAARADVGQEVGILSAVVQTFADAARFCDRALPTTGLEAKFSLQHSVAVALHKGRPELSDFHPDRIDHEPVAALRSRIAVAVTDEFEAAYPRRYGSAVTISLADGREKRFSAPDALGDPENPLSGDEIADKARMLMTEAGLSAQAMDKLVGGCLALPESADVNGFAASLP